MKKLIFYIFTLTLLIACNNQESNVETGNDYKKLDTTVSIAGIWLNNDYAESIAKNKSPKEAQEGARLLIIPARTLQPTSIIDNFHEGRTELLIIKNNRNYEIWEADEDTATSKIYDISIISDTAIKVGNTTFTKLSLDNPDDPYKILENILFKGAYVSDNNTTIIFKPNGTIQGLANYTLYEPVIDYFDEGLDMDQIALGTSPDNMEKFGFKFNSNTLELYKIICTSFDKTANHCEEVGYGELVYKLNKK